LHIRSLENDEVRKISITPKPTFYRSLAWSPDGRKLVFCDRLLNLWLADAEKGSAIKVDTSDYSAQSDWRFSFSPDSRFLAYSKRLKNRAGTVFIYDVAQKRSFQITDGITDAESPVFDANGKYLYFISSPNALTSEYGWGVLNGILSRPLVYREIQAFALAAETPLPFLPDGRPNPDARVSEAASSIKIDFRDPEDRLFSLPLRSKDYNRIIAGRAGKLFLVVDGWGDTPGDPRSSQNTSIHLFDLGRAGDMKKIVEDIGGYEITGDGSKLLYIRGRDWFLVDSETAPKGDEGKIDLANITVDANPAEEWKQIFNESVRIMRDWFYDPNHHGQDLNALKTYYAKYLPTITRRRDLNSLIERMLGSVSVSHFGVGGGDIPPSERSSENTGLLGATYTIENGHFRFKTILRTTTYASANGSARAPLDQRGIDVREGDYLLEVNGTKADTDKGVLSYFKNTSNKPTKITVSSNADGSQPREYTVYPILTERSLRTANWAENNRRLVEKLSNGKLGYIFIEAFGETGISNAIRGLSGYSDKQGVIIDQRFNGGGITPDYLIEWMQRKPLYHYMFRAGDDLPTPVNQAPPVKVMLINEWNGSAAETNAFMFKLGKVGTMVGKRTAGAGIGSYFFHPRFIDNGRIQIPNRGAYMSDGSSWGIENYGVEPDFDVEIMPQDLMAGRDPQLEKAIEVALDQIRQTPAAKPKHPPFPVHPGTLKQRPER
ncbi:MAG: PDZ domain-containing protein, partial [Acidobacteria bacterium]|nr:PDZ domain-containing protein [Acidobacteriota bacterium]